MKAFLFFMFLLNSLVIYAQDSLKTFELNEVIVTGEVEPQSIGKSVYNVRTISSERLKAQGATRLQDVLNTELNVRFSQDLVLGGSNLSMMGLPGQNVKVLIDGVPMIGRQGTGNEININQINISSIERIEIVEGPMAVIYGADALGGVINIITKKAGEHKLDVTATLHEETAGNEYGSDKGIHNENLNLLYRIKSFYMAGNVNRNDFRGWTGDSTGREKAWHPKSQWLSGVVAGFKNDKVNVYYRLDNLHEKIYNPADFSGNEAIDQNYITKRMMHQVQLNASLSDKLSYSGAFSYTGFSRRTQSIAVNKVTGRETLANSALQNIDEFSGGTLRGSFLYRFSENFSLQPGYDINLEAGKGSRLKPGENAIEDYAMFLSGDFRPNSFLSVRPGIRFIRNSVYDAPPVVPSVNTKFTLNDHHDIRLSYGRGFRAPSIRELYFNFFDASHSIEGNPDLKPELSHSLNLSWNARLIQTPKSKLVTILAGFYNSVENMIDFGRKPGGNVTTYINVDRYQSKGFSLNNAYTLQKAEFRAGLAYTGRYNDLSDTDDELPEFTWSPEITGSLTYFIKENDFSISTYYKYTGKTPQYIIIADEESTRLAKTNGFHWADITIQKQVIKYLSLSLGVRNIFDVTSISSSVSGSAHSGSGTTKPVGYGRSYFVSLNFQLTK